ncbi:MAG TPA: alpha/beta hydrolase [Campylobacterales bacterium]|nr:alpha/beta hydrolase [Campylobacterales bacterium]
MKYFNGYSLKGEEEFFSEFLIDSDYTIAGFSHGAQKAFEYVLNSTERIDRLILISPAFFQNHKKSFIKTQLRYFKVDKEAYREEFLKNVAYPSTNSLDTYISEGTYEELNDLLSYVWDEDKILELKSRGISIEVFMGDADKIVDFQKSFEFFSKRVSVYVFKGKGHLVT